MTTENLTWEDAALRIVESATDPLRTTDVGEMIVQQQLTKSVGSAPTQQASQALRSLLKKGKIVQVGKLYALPATAKRFEEEEAAQEEAAESAAANPAKFTVKAYGLY